jgi:hypothetical protein
MNKVKSLRFQKTLELLDKHIAREKKILDLGTPNPLSEFLQEKGFQIESGFGFDFDLNPEDVNKYDYEVLTAFEVFEHLVSPFPLLQKTKARQLVITVPLKLWFAKAHRNMNDPYDQHYHEFESWQLDMLLEKAGWEIKVRQKWTPPFIFNGGLRSFLRAITPRFYAVYAERKN